MRKNVLYLVRYGFTREEVYFMPAGEVIDYIKIINDDIRQENEEIALARMERESSNSGEEYNMAGNTIPGLF